MDGYHIFCEEQSTVVLGERLGSRHLFGSIGL